MKEIRSIAVSHEIEKFPGDGWNLNLVTRKTESIKPELLLENGVSLATIQKATVVNETSFYQLKRTK